MYLSCDHGLLQVLSRKRQEPNTTGDEMVHTHSLLQPELGYSPWLQRPKLEKYSVNTGCYSRSQFEISARQFCMRKHYIMSMASFPDYVCLGTRPISQVQRRLRGGRTQIIKSWSWSRKACWYFFMTHRSLSQLDPQGTLNWIHSRKHWF